MLALDKGAFDAIAANQTRNTMTHHEVVDFFNRFIDAAIGIQSNCEIPLLVNGYKDGGTDTSGGIYLDYTTYIEVDQCGRCEFGRIEARKTMDADDGVEMLKVSVAERGAFFANADGWMELCGADPEFDNGSILYTWRSRFIDQA